jgi:alanyl-tRNA synthetase
LAGAIERTQLEAKQLRKTVSRLQESLAGHEATRLLADAPTVNGVRTVVHAFEGWDAPGLKAIATALSSQGGATAALFSAVGPFAVVIARSQGVSLDASKVVRVLMDRYGGRGGGRPDLAQGAGLTGDLQQILAAAQELLRTT